MKKIWDPIIRTADDLQNTAGRLIDGSVQFFRAKLGSLKLLSSSNAEVGSERDETHYLLVPSLQEPSGYGLYRTRSLPEGVGPENDLPKVRIFHLPAAGTEELLADLICRELKEEKLEGAELESGIANRLEMIADEIDRQCDRVSGGLLLVGGVVAIANPLLGVGIAAKSLLPGIGSKLSVHGIKHASGWLQSRKKQSAQSEAEKGARKEVARLEPEIRENAILAILERVLNSPDGNVDPLLESAKLFQDSSEGRDLKIASQAVSRVYDERSSLSPLLTQWLQHLDEVGSS